jgi:hypothetical protein
VDENGRKEGYRRVEVENRGDRHDQDSDPGVQPPPVRRQTSETISGCRKQIIVGCRQPY